MLENAQETRENDTSEVDAPTGICTPIPLVKSQRREPAQGFIGVPFASDVSSLPSATPSAFTEGIDADPSTLLTDRTADGHRRVDVVCQRCSRVYRIRKPRPGQNYRRFCPNCRPIALTENFTTPESTKSERIRANGVINMRIKRGLVDRPTACMKCEKTCRPDSHHPDYEKPIEVVWLCRSCHMLTHRDPAFIAGLVPVVLGEPVKKQRRRSTPSATVEVRP